MALWLGVTIVSWSVFNWLFKFLSSQPKTYPPEVKVQDNGRLEVDVKALLETPEGRRAIEQLKKRIDDEITKETYGKWPQ